MARVCGLMCLVGLWGGAAWGQPGVGNRCVMWGSVFLEDGSRSLRFAPEPIPDGPHYLHYIVMLNGNEDKILTEMAPKWDPHEDVNIPGNGFYGCELGNFTAPATKPGDKVQIIVTDEAAGQQGTAEATVPELPGAIGCDVRLQAAKVSVPPLRLEEGRLVWGEAAPVTLVYQRLQTDRYPNGRPRGQYTLVARLTGGETAWQTAETQGAAWVIVQKDAGGRVTGRSREVRTFREPDGFESLIAVTDSGALCTVDVGAGRVTVRDAEGKRTGEFSLRDGTTPVWVRGWGERLEVGALDAKGRALPEVYVLEGSLTQMMMMGPPMEVQPPAAGTGLERGSVMIEGGKRLVLDGLAKRVVEVDGQRAERSFSGAAFGGLSKPRGIAAHDGLVYVLDGRRIAVVPDALEEEMPEVKDGVVRWRTGAPVESRVTVSGQGQEVSFGDSKPTREHEVKLGQLPGPGKYRVSVSHSIRVLGEEPTWASVPLLIPPAKKAQHAYLRVRVAIVILANMVQRRKAPEGVELPGPVSDADIERLKREMLIGQRFYWINSHLRFLPAMDFIIDREFHDLNPYDDAPNRENLAPLFAREGKSLDDYDGVCRLVVEQTYDANAKAWRIASSGGGLTSGVSKGSKDPGWSWWPAGAGDFFIPDSWLFVHEYGHQVDAMFDASGEPSFWGNHFAPQEGNVARFGEHFDGNAYLLRLWPAEKWFTSDWGTVEFADDADEDGVPDDAPEVPIDEKRFGSDPTRKDTDKDGLSDRDEVMAWKGITVGLGQVWARPVLPDPRNPDTDGDGLRDGRDPYPLCPFPTAMRTRSHPIGGGGLCNTLTFSGTLKVGGEEVMLAVKWGPEYVWLGLGCGQPRSLFVQLDADNDGWFAGKDNYQLTVEPPAAEGGQPKVRVFIVNAAEPGKWPFGDETLVRPEDIRVKVWEEGGTLEVGIPGNEATGLRLERGERMGLNLGFSDPSRPGTYLTLCQPHELMEMRLVDPWR